VGIPETDDGDDEPFEAKINRLTSELSDQFEKDDTLKQEIRENLEEIGYNAN